MQGNIDFIGSLSGAISGASGGSEVTITPTVQSGRKIADYTIDETSGSLYAPDTGSDVTITPTVQSGTKIADYTIDSESGSLYIPTPPVVPSHIVNDLTPTFDGYPKEEIATFQKDSGTTEKLYCPDYTTEYHTSPDISTDILIGWIDNNLGRQDIYIPSQSGGSSWNYSTTEVNTGQKWTNGKDLYCKVIDTNSVVGLIETIAGADFILIDNAYIYNPNNNTYVKLAYYWANAERGYVYNVGNSIYLNSVNLTVQNYPKILVIVRYTKSA